MEHCEICNRSFANKHSLRTHRSRYHGPNSKDELSDTRTTDASKFSGSENNEYEKDTSDYSSSSGEVPEKDTPWSQSDERVLSKKRYRQVENDFEKRRRNYDGEQSYSLHEYVQYVNEMLKYHKLIKLLATALLDGTLPITPAQVKELKQYADTIRQISNGSQEELESILNNAMNNNVLGILLRTISFNIDSIFRRDISWNI